MAASSGRGTVPGASVGAPGEAVCAPDVAEARRILALLQADDIDAAIGAGLARFVSLDALGAEENDALADARDRLLAAWAARERYRAREARLERIGNERRSARGSRPPAPTHADASAADIGAASANGDPVSASAADAAPVSGPSRTAAPGTAPQPEATTGARSRPALPPSAAAALARARARASGRGP